MEKVNKILGLFILTMIILATTSCKDTDIDSSVQNITNQIGETETLVVDVESELEKLDWSQDHMEADLTDQFAISADIVSDTIYKNSFSLYHYKMNEEDSDSDDYMEMRFLAEKELAETYDSFFGTTYAEKYSDGTLPSYGMEPSFYISSTAGKYSWSCGRVITDPKAYTLEVFYPIHIDGYDETKISQLAEEVMDRFQNFISFEDYTIDCIWVCDALYETMNNSFSEELSPIGENDGNERFEIVLRPKLDHGVSFSYIYDLTIQTNEVRIYADSNFHIDSIHGLNDIEIDRDAFETVEIVELKEILLEFYNRYNYGNKKTVTNVKLYYGVYEDEEKEDSYLAPYWIVTYYEEGRDTMYRCVYSALDGELLWTTLNGSNV